MHWWLQPVASNAVREAAGEPPNQCLSCYPLQSAGSTFIHLVWLIQSKGSFWAWRRQPMRPTEQTHAVLEPWQNKGPQRLVDSPGASATAAAPQQQKNERNQCKVSYAVAPSKAKGLWFGTWPLAAPQNKQESRAALLIQVPHVSQRQASHQPCTPPPRRDQGSLVKHPPPFQNTKLEAAFRGYRQTVNQQTSSIWGWHLAAAQSTSPQVANFFASQPGFQGKK